MSTPCDCTGTLITLSVKGFGATVDAGNLPSTDLSALEERIKTLKEYFEKELEKAVSLAKQSAPYQLCEFYSFRNPQKKKGFELAHGELLENAIEHYPDAWAFLQTDEGKALCVTEEEWQAMNHAVYYTATSTDETEAEVKQEFSFDGIGGAPFFVQNLCYGTLRLPDIRGMYMEAAGFDDLAVGGVHGDMVRNVKGYIEGLHASGKSVGVFSMPNPARPGEPGGKYIINVGTSYFDSSRVVPTGNANKPRAFGVLPCVYLGSSK